MKYTISTILILSILFCKGQSDTIYLGESGFTGTFKFGYGYPSDRPQWHSDTMFYYEPGKSFNLHGKDIKDSVIMFQQKKIVELQRELEMWKFLYFITNDEEKQPNDFEDKLKPFNQ